MDRHVNVMVLLLDTWKMNVGGQSCLGRLGLAA